jgi:hypothetical protein
VTLRLSIDRFEGDRKQIAVLLTEDGRPINFPKALLPKGAKAGDAWPSGGQPAPPQLVHDDSVYFLVSLCEITAA